MLDERNCARAHTFAQTACFVRAVHVFVCQCDLSQLNLFIAAIILLLFHFGYCSWCICYGMFSILCLAVSAMVCDIYLILHHSINIGWKKERDAHVSADSYFSHLYRFSCILSFLVLRHIRNVLLWLLMQQRLFNAKLLLKICSILFYCIFVTFFTVVVIVFVCFECYWVRFFRTNVALDLHMRIPRACIQYTAQRTPTL